MIVFSVLTEEAEETLVSTMEHIMDAAASSSAVGKGDSEQRIYLVSSIE